MKIAVYTPWIKSKGGAERLIFEYAERSSHEIDILTHYQEESFEGYGTTPNVLSDSKTPSGFIRKGLQAGYRILLSDLDLTEYDAFIVSEAGISSLITLRNSIEPTICYCHTPLRAAHHFYEDYKKEYGLLGRQAFRAAVHGYSVLEHRAWNNFDKVICNSTNTLSIVEQAGLAKNTPKEVIYPGADIDYFQNRESEDYFLYPSRFKPYKRQELAIQSFKEFNERQEGDFRLILAGYPDDPDYLDELRDLADDSIEFRTDVSDDEMVELYAEAIAVLFTAEREDWGIVPIEGMAAGKPVIAVDEGGPAESIIDGETGFLVDAAPVAIASAMERLVTDNNLYKKLSTQAEERANEFTWDAFTRRLDSEVETSAQQP